MYVCIFACLFACPPEKESWADSCFCRPAWQAEALLFIVMLDGGTYQPWKGGRKEERSVCVDFDIDVCAQCYIDMQTSELGPKPLN